MNRCNFAQTIIEQSQSYLSKIAVRDGYEDLTYQDLVARIQKTANGLEDSGLTAGDRVIINMEDCIDWPVVFLACVYKNIIPLPLSTTIGQDLFVKIAKFIDCKVIIAGDTQADQLVVDIPIISKSQVRQFYLNFTDVAAPAMVHPDSECWLNISSGSTGMPKVAVHRHQNLYEILKLSPRISYSMDSSSVIMSIAKMSWNFGLHNSVTYALGLGATAVVIPGPPAATTIFDYANRFNPTIIVTSPSIIKRLLNLKAYKYQWPKSIKHFHSSGEHLPKSMYDDFLKKFGLKLNSCIGMMETSTNYCANPDWEHDPGTIGKPLPGCKIKIIDQDDNVVSEVNKIGEIFVSSPANAYYYLKNYTKTKSTFVGEWVRTGDCGYINKNGNLVFTGRIDDLFKVNDLIVSPVEIESSILCNVTAVDQVAVVGIQNSQGVKEVNVFVVPAEQFDLQEFKHRLTQILFSHQIPKHIHIVNNLPETMTSKKDRRSLAEMAVNVTKL